jgi:predicted RNase H-like HicB family nuclease
MRSLTAVLERCPDTGLYVGYVPGFAGAHSQAESLDERIAWNKDKSE